MKVDAALRLTAVSDQELVTVTFKIPKNCEAATNVPNILSVLAFMGSAGCSRTITIEDMGEGGGDLKFGFDGDGSDKLEDFTVDGKPWTYNARQKMMR